MATEINDLNIIQDEDTLRRMWQDTEDFSRKKEIRLRMYRLREERLKSYYITRETAAESAVASHKPAISSHAESLSDQGFLTMKTKEIRDSASPTLDVRQSSISSLSASSQSEQLANQNIVTTSRQTVERKSYNSSGSSSNQRNADQTSSTVVTYGTSAIPYNGNTSEMIPYGSQDLHNNHEKSIKSVQSSATEKYSTSSRREVESSSVITENRQQKIISNNYSSNHNLSHDNTDHQVGYINKKISVQNVDNFADNTAQQSQQSIEYHDANISHSRIPDTSSKISISKHNNQEYNYLRSSPAPTVVNENISIEDTASSKNYGTKVSTDRLSQTKRTTNKTVSESQQNFDHNIMKELQKLDSYLSTEAVTNSSSPSSPAPHYINETQIVDQNTKSSISKQREPTLSQTTQEPTDHTTTYQQAYSKISVDTSATHNAFASSLRASPDRSSASPGKRTPSRTSLDRSTPDRSPRISPEKSSCNDLSRKYTASFQNRVSRNSTHMRDSKSSSPTKYTEPKRKQRSRSSSLETDSDDSSATYNTKVIDSTTSKNRNFNNRNLKTEYENSFGSINEKRIPGNRYTSPTKSSGHTSEGSVEREIGKHVKSQDSSPERSAFKPVISNKYGKSITTIEQVQTLNKNQHSPQKKSSPDICPGTTSSRQQSLSPNFKKQSSPPLISTNYQHAYTDLSNQQKTQKHSSTKLSTSIKAAQKTTVDIKEQPSQTQLSSPVDKSQSSPKRQSSPQIITSNTCSVENITNRHQIEIKRQSSPQIHISAENIHKPEPKRHPSLQTVITTNNANNNDDNKTEYQEEFDGTQIMKVIDHKQPQLKKHCSKEAITENRPSNSNEQLSSQTTLISNTYISGTSQNIAKPKQISSSQIVEPVKDCNKPSSDKNGPMKPKRQSPKQEISTTVTTVSSVISNNINENVQKQPKSTGVPAATKNVTEIKQISEPKKKLSKNRLSSPEKLVNPSKSTIESIDIEITSHDKSTSDSQKKNKDKKKIKTSSIMDGRVIDVDESDAVEEIKVKTTPTNAKLTSKNSKTKKQTNSKTKESAKDENIKPSLPKQRSSSCNEFSTPRKRTSIPTSVTTVESTDESSSSSDYSSEDEREEVTIEEIFDEFGTPIPRETNPLEAALKLEAAIKSKEQVDREQQLTENISLIPEDKVNPHMKNESEAFIKQEKIIQEGDEDNCLPPIEQVLGKDVDKAALNDFLEWERKQSHHKHTHSQGAKENEPNNFITTEKHASKPEINQKVIEPIQATAGKSNKYPNKPQKLESVDKVTPTETNQSPADRNVISKTLSTKKLKKDDIQTISNLKSPAKKPKESPSSPLSKPVTKQSSNRDIIQTKKSANITPKVSKQLSDRSLKEKNDKLQNRKLDHQHKTRSEVLIKPAKPSNVYQRRVTDQVQSNTLSKSNLNNSFNKENQADSKSSKIVPKESPQKISTTVKDTTVTQTRYSKPVNKPVSRKTTPAKTISPTPHKILQTNVSFQTNANKKEKVVLRESEPKLIRGKPKSSQKIITEKVVKLDSKKSKEKTISESSTSTSSSVENLHNELNTYDTSRSQAHQEESIECIERVQRENKVEQRFQTSITESKDNHLNVVVRMPSSSRETTPNKPSDDRFHPVTDDNEGVPRYADRVTSPDDIDVNMRRRSTNLSTFEKITDLDEEDETSDTDLANASVAERRTKFLESAKETTTTKQTTIVEDDLFQNRELGVSKTKEMFETIAKNQVPGNNPPILKAPPIISRPSVFEAGATVVELGHDGVHHIVSKKLTEQDYEDYRHECEDAARIDITKITKSFEDKAAENSKQIMNIKPKKTEIKIQSFTKENPLKETSKPVNSNIESTKVNTSTVSSISVDTYDDNKCTADYCTTLSHIESKNNEQRSNPSSICTSPTRESKTLSKQPSTPAVVPKTQSPIKSHSRSPSLSPTRDYSNRQPANPSKPITVQDHSSPSRHNQPTSPEIKHTTNTTSKTDRKGDIIQSTTHRYEIRRNSPTKDTVSQKPIEITQIEVRPSKQVYEHTAITNVQNVSSKFTPVEETFNQKLTRYSDTNVNSSLTKPTESSKRRTSKSPSPEKAPLELSFTPKKSYSPPKDTVGKSSKATSSSTVTTLKRQKSPSPDKVTSKLRNKFTTSTNSTETKRKKFEKRLSTTGSDYQKRKKFFETNTSHNNPKQSHPSSVTKYEITVRSTTKNEKPGISSSYNRSSSEKSPTRRSPSKSPERIYKPRVETNRKVTEETTTTSRKIENRSSPTKTIVTTTTTTTTTEPKRFTSSPERRLGSSIKRTSPEKITKKEPFGVTLRKTKTPSSTTSTTSVKQVKRVEGDHIVEEIFANGKKIEEIFNLELLEIMLEKAVQYDLRSRIRAQIRLVKRQQETIKTSRTPSPEKSSPTRKTKISPTTPQTSQTISSSSRSEVDSRLSGSSTLDRRDKVKKRLFTDEKTTSESKSSFTSSSTLSNHNRRTRTGSPVKISETNDLNQNTYQTDFGSALTTNNVDCKSTTDSIISGYGVGPTDENGRPLFGLKALRTSSEAKISVEDLDKGTKIKTNYEREITDHAGRPLFGLKALQKSSKFAEDQLDSSLNERQQSRKYDDNRTVKTESSSHVYSSRTAMRSDGSGNVSVYRDEVKGELFSKDGKDPTGKMIATRYTYRKPEGEEATVKTETTSSYLNAKSNSSAANQIGDSSDKWKSSTSSKLGSSSLIRKISNEHFEKAQRKFSSGDETTTAWNESDRKGSVDSTSKYETSSSSRQHKSFSKTDSSEKVYTQRYSTESSSSTKRESFDGQSSTDVGNDYGKVHTSTISSSTSYGHQTNDEQPRVSRNDSLKDVKSKFQQATVSSTMRNASKSSDGRTSPTKLQASRRSPDIEKTGTQSSFSSHKSNTQSSDGNYYYETRSYTESSSSNSQDLLSRAKDSSFRPQSEYTDEEKEAASLLNKLVGKSVNLREMQSVPKTTSSVESITSKAATLVQKFEKQQNKTKQNKEEFNVEQIWDEDQLRDLLEACTDYESRRQIRARLRAIMAENKADADVIAAPTTNADIAPPKNDTSPTRTVTTSRSDSFSTVTKVQSKTSSTGRMVKANSVTSPFSKFRQLERQHSMPSSGAPTTKIANPNLTRSATSIKDRLLNWVKAQTKEYENVQIDNFSTSWNNGLAFCALIHHFCPHAFDYNKLTPDQRRHNFELAFRVAEEEAGIVPLLDVEDMVAMLRPDWKCVFCYVQSVYQRFQATSAAVRPE